MAELRRRRGYAKVSGCGGRVEGKGGEEVFRQIVRKGEEWEAGFIRGESFGEGGMGV